MTKEILGKPVEASFSADGSQSDTTTCSLNLITWKVGKYYLYRMANFYHSGADTGLIKSMSEYAKKIKQFKEWCYREWAWMPKDSQFFVDPACKSLSEELRDFGIVTTKADNNLKDKVTSNGTKIEIMKGNMLTIISLKN
ncbi:hypothetical protein D922_02233 [Enterococcus faecalis 06-MB-DW-09]|nr:hypothetical protein D922_02233 [Enterococcus faecalis 06-MB-DW-09]